MRDPRCYFCVDQIFEKPQALRCELHAELAQLGVTVRAHSRSAVAEEMPAGCKDVADVVDAMEAAGVTQKAARLKPFAVSKG